MSDDSPNITPDTVSDSVHDTENSQDKPVKDKKPKPIGAPEQESPEREADRETADREGWNSKGSKKGDHNRIPPEYKNNDILKGGAEDDILVAGKQARMMIGGDGADIFVLTLRRGMTVVKDFNATEGDKLSLMKNITFEELTFKQVGGNTVIETMGEQGPQKIALLQEVQANSITVDSFVDLPDLPVSPSKPSSGHDRNESRNELRDQSKDEPIRSRKRDKVLRGSDRNDILIGRKDKSILVGGLGDDILVAGKHTRQMTGGVGKDTFILRLKQGVTVIKDFDSLEGDKLSLAQGMNFEDLIFKQVGKHTMIDKGSRTIALLQGVQVNSITPDSFVAVPNLTPTASSPV